MNASALIIRPLSCTTSNHDFIDITPSIIDKIVILGMVEIRCYYGLTDPSDSLFVAITKLLGKVRNLEIYRNLKK